MEAVIVLAILGIVGFICYKIGQDKKPVAGVSDAEAVTLTAALQAFNKTMDERKAEEAQVIAKHMQLLGYLPTIYEELSAIRQLLGGEKRPIKPINEILYKKEQ
jgi:hypothetical protein